MSYALGVDVGRQNYSKTALAIVHKLIRFTHPQDGDVWLPISEIYKIRERWAKNSLVWDVRFNAPDPDWDDGFFRRVDYGDPRYNLTHLGRYISDVPHAKIIDELIDLHSTPPLNDGMPSTFAINAVGQTFVERFRDQAARRDVWSNPRALQVRSGTGYTEGDWSTPGSLGVDELLGSLNVLMGSKTSDGQPQVNYQVNGRHYTALLNAINNQEDARYHYDAEALMMQGRNRDSIPDGYDLLYAFAIAVWTAHNKIHGESWFFV